MSDSIYGYREYRLPDGDIIGGYNQLELVESMAHKKFTAPRSRASYRRASAKRAQRLYGVEVDPTTDETFIASLHAARLLTEIV